VTVPLTNTREQVGELNSYASAELDAAEQWMADAATVIVAARKTASSDGRYYLTTALAVFDAAHPTKEEGT
jgi:succinylarginine dihydrolase